MRRMHVVVVCALAGAAAMACGIDAVGTLAIGGPSSSDDGRDGGEQTPSDGAPLGDDGASTVEVDPTGGDASSEGGGDGGPSPVACPESGGVVSANHCYFPIAPTTQPLAKQACAAAGAHLVTVSSLAEHTVLATVGTGDRWIGLEAPMPTNTRAEYVWVTGEPSTVTYWYVNDPDNLGPCVALHGTLQEWVDRGCGDTNPAICERE